MDKELERLLKQARKVTLSTEELDESNIKMAVANGLISDNRVTIDALRSAQGVKEAAARVKA